MYRLSTLLPSWPFDQRLWFALVMQLVMALFDTASLVLVYATARLIGSRARALRSAALFAGAFILAYAASSWYEPIPLFLLLLALYLTLRDRHAWSALAAGVGIMVKIFPIVVVPLAIRRIAQARKQAGYLTTLALTAGGILLPFLIVRPDFVLAFIRSTLNRPTWLSIWALFDGNYLYGAAVPAVDRFTAENVGAPYLSQLPWPIIHAAFLGLFLYIFTRRITWRDPVRCVAFGGLTVNLFLLWSKGFSGQFIVYVLPFIILLMPNLRGALYAGLLSAIWVAEWPIAFTMLEGQKGIIVWIVIARTATLIALCVEYAARLFPSSGFGRVSVWTRLAPRLTASVLLLGWISLGPVAIISVDAYTQTRIAADRAAPALDVIRDGGGDPSPIVVFAQSRLYRRLYPAARAVGSPTLLPIFTHVPEPARIEWLNGIASQGPFWFIADEGDAETQDANRRAEAWMSEHACKIETTLAGSTRVSRFVGMPENPAAIEVSAVFADEIELVAARVSQTALRPGGELCVELNWESMATPSGDYTVFVHLVDAQGRLVAQNDQPPRAGFAPTSGWAVGELVSDAHGLILPADLAAGDYVVRAGMYRSMDQTPVPVTRGAPITPEARGIILVTLTVAP
jgi:hypothetical protein